VTRGAALLATAPLLLTCASNQTIATIEPTPTNPGPPGGSDAIDMAAPARPASRKPVEDAVFVLSREPGAAVGAAKPVGGPGGGEFDWIHVAEKWWKFRAEFVKLWKNQPKRALPFRGL